MYGNLKIAMNLKKMPARRAIKDLGNVVEVTSNGAFQWDESEVKTNKNREPYNRMHVGLGLKDMGHAFVGSQTMVALKGIAVKQNPVPKSDTQRNDCTKGLQ